MKIELYQGIHKENINTPTTHTHTHTHTHTQNKEETCVFQDESEHKELKFWDAMTLEISF